MISFLYKNRPGFHCGNRGGSFVLLVLFQALTQSLAGILDSSLSGCQNYRALGKNDNTFLSSRKSYSRNISCSIVTPYCKILSFLCKKAAAPEKPARATLFAGTCTGATGRTSRRNTLIYQRRQRSPSGTFNAGISQRSVDHLLQHLICTVAMCAPASAQSVIWMGLRTEAAMISVWMSG